MTEKVTIRCCQWLPMPLIYLATPQSMADWYSGQLLRSWEQGSRRFTLSCFDSESMGYPLSQAAPAVLRAVADFLYDHPEAEQVSILCAGETCCKAYTYYWNLWYAERKPEP